MESTAKPSHGMAFKVAKVVAKAPVAPIFWLARDIKALYNLAGYACTTLGEEWRATRALAAEPINDSATLDEARKRFLKHAKEQGDTSATIATKLRSAKRFHALYLFLLTVALSTAIGEALTHNIESAILGAIGAAVLALHVFAATLSAARLETRSLLSWRQFASRPDAIRRFFMP